MDLRNGFACRCFTQSISWRVMHLVPNPNRLFMGSCRKDLGWRERQYVARFALASGDGQRLLGGIVVLE